MEKQIKKLLDFYKCSFGELAQKIGITERQLYNVKNGKYIGRFLREKIENMVKKIEEL